MLSTLLPTIALDMGWDPKIPFNSCPFIEMGLIPGWDL